MRARNSVQAAVAVAALLLAAPLADARDFESQLERIDEAIRKNPSHVPGYALDACSARRQYAIRLYRQGRSTRAERSLDYCFALLKISEEPPEKVDPAAEKRLTMEQIQARAAREVEQALHLEPDVARGLEIYRSCALCHTPEGFGLWNGSVPQIAGQHRTVVIKQLADIRAGNRDAVLMIPYASAEAIGGAQAVADVAGYIDTLEIGVDGGKGPGDDLELGEKLYVENCARCHGPEGEGDAEAFVPRIQSQHYQYLVRQFEWIRDGKRRNANPEMAAQIQDFDERQEHAVLDYVSRLEPPEELQAPPGWTNPDFGPPVARAP
jgi:cytochrome c553